MEYPGFRYIQGGQLYMAVLFWFLEKRDLSSVRYWTVAYTNLTYYATYQKDRNPGLILSENNPPHLASPDFFWYSIK